MKNAGKWSERIRGRRVIFRYDECGHKTNMQLVSESVSSEYLLCSMLLGLTMTFYSMLYFFGKRKAFRTIAAKL